MCLYLGSVSSLGNTRSWNKKTSQALPMAVLFLLLLFLCGTPQAAVDNIRAIYVALGEAMELPCPSPPTLHGDELLSWFHSPVAGSFTTLVAQDHVARPASDPGKPGRESRLKLLGNYSLWLEGSKEGDAGRYWCAVLGQHHNYQNWRVYDVSVLRGSQLSARAADGSPCSVLLCSVVPSRRLDSVTWQEGRGPVRGRVQSFWGDGAALLLVCPGEGLPEPRGRRPRTIRCLMPHNKGVSFSLAASPTLCAPSTGWDVPWILLLLLTVGQGVAILALSIVLWSRRAQGAPSRDASIPQFKPEIQVYENIHLARLSPPAHKTR
ncbi:lymphocyte antigen 6 complex locus protein G6f-like isoform X1 [Lemur catta]|uniref:lymphocyte antigen 6 complex locus protein G6f-like isoform X1 n=1 Tax=Lemur catta TaxID=9447 RepID=UPI001E266FA2|nr:lymphocyte antigen 6 complex locus protein G6f-like isoform X1 [Lemur catta]